MTLLGHFGTKKHNKRRKPTIAAQLKIDVDGRKVQLRVPGLIDTEVEALKNPVTGDEHRARIDLPFGKEFQQAEVASGTTKATGAVGLEFANSHAHLVDNQITSKGVRN